MVDVATPQRARQINSIQLRFFIARGLLLPRHTAQEGEPEGTSCGRAEWRSSPLRTMPTVPFPARAPSSRVPIANLSRKSGKKEGRPRRQPRKTRLRRPSASRIRAPTHMPGGPSWPGTPEGQVQRCPRAGVWARGDGDLGLNHKTGPIDDTCELLYNGRGATCATRHPDPGVETGIWHVRRAATWRTGR